MTKIVNFIKLVPRHLRNLVGRLPVDDKLISAGVAYALTLLVAKVGLDLDSVLIPDYLTVAQGVALAASAIAGYFTANEGTLLRQGVEDGNPDMSLARESDLPT